MRLVEELDFSFRPATENFYDEALSWAEKYLLRQGPLEYFVHHNTLHAFEDSPFIEALFKTKGLFKAQTHMPLTWFIKQYEEQRITRDDLEYSITKNLGENFLFPIAFKWTKETVLLEHPKKKAFLKGFLEHNKGRLKKFDSDFHQITTFWENTSTKFRSEKLKKELVNLKFKFLSAYFDKGTAYWSMEEKAYGLDHCFSLFIKYLPNTALNKELKRAYQELSKKASTKKVLELFHKELDIPDKHLKNYLFQILTESKGWTGLIYAINENPNFNPTFIKCSKKDYILLTLSFELAGYRYLKANNDLKPFVPNYYLAKGYEEEIQSFLYDELLKNYGDHKQVQDAFNQNPGPIFALNLQLLVKIWQEAYEAHLYFDLIKNHAKAHPKITESNPLTEERQRPTLQVITCIDDREESTRRHFEEYDKNIETFGYAGHFGLNIKYKSLRDAHYRALCPVNANPSKYVFEEVIPGEKLNYSVLAQLKHFLFHNSNLPLLGSFLSLILGPFTGMLFLFENIFPKRVHQLRKVLKRKMFPKVQTRLNFEKHKDRALEGFSDEELAQAAYTMISITGLNKAFGKIVYLCGHGSKSMNNPHGAAYNCGACAGGKGAPNARLMANALNKESIRVLLKQKGVFIPKDTLFIGGYHCTSTGKLLVFDENEETKEHDSFAFLKQACHYVELHESKERMRKFENVPLSVNPQDAFLAAQNRSYDYSQPRPEYGHNTNAFCLVGDRANNSNLFLDRRAFLVSYENRNDPTGDNLLALLSAVIPVCAGINLEYYFSFVDQQVFGAGVKQAHNVTSLMGVMNGYSSDLQLGLPWQMVEIHEPARITFLIEADKEKLDAVLEQNIEVRNLVRNEWVLLILKTSQGEYLLYGPNGETELTPAAETHTFEDKSQEVYLNTRKILPVAHKGEK